MGAHKSSFVLINVVGGIAVLASYTLWLGNPSNQSDALWGSIAGTWRLLYTASMFTAAAGYFAFFSYVLRYAPDPDGDQALTWLNTIFTLILFPSALWMPLSFEYLDAPTAGLWWAIRGTLLVVAAASLALLVILVRLAPRTPRRGRALAIAGAVAFCFQTGLLDACVWPLFFPR